MHVLPTLVDIVNAEYPRKLGNIETLSLHDKSSLKSSRETKGKSPIFLFPDLLINLECIEQEKGKYKLLNECLLRTAILSGQEIWRTREAGLLMGAIPKDLKLFTHILSDNGYHVGYTGKGWAPGNWMYLG